MKGDEVEEAIKAMRACNESWQITLCLILAMQCLMLCTILFTGTPDLMDRIIGNMPEATVKNCGPEKATN